MYPGSGIAVTGPRFEKSAFPPPLTPDAVYTFPSTTALGAGNIDTITDFSVADDTIALLHGVFAGLAPGALSTGAFNTGATASDANDRILYDSTSGALRFDRDGTGTTYAAVQFATIGAGLTLSAADFVVT